MVNGLWSETFNPSTRTFTDLLWVAKHKKILPEKCKLNTGMHVTADGRSIAWWRQNSCVMPNPCKVVWFSTFIVVSLPFPQSLLNEEYLIKERKLEKLYFVSSFSREHDFDRCGIKMVSWVLPSNAVLTGGSYLISYLIYSKLRFAQQPSLNVGHFRSFWISI